MHQSITGTLNKTEIGKERIGKEMRGKERPKYGCLNYIENEDVRAGMLEQLCYV